jgi:dethiobiotin synthetase
MHYDTIFFHPYLFITGTDTDVGKTYVTAQLAQIALEAGKTVAIYKPVQTGVNTFEEGDAYACAKHLDFPENLHIETTYSFSPPAAPSVCDDERVISIEAIVARFHELKSIYDVVLVEGAGGVLCPITKEALMLDLIEALGIPVVLVSRYTLGTINHSLMSLELLKHRDVTVEALVLSEGALPLSEAVKSSLAVQTVVSLIKHYTPELNIWEVPYAKGLTESLKGQNTYV